MSIERNSVILAGYNSPAAAETDFDRFKQAVADGTVRAEGAIMVEKDASGQVTVSHSDPSLASRVPVGVGARLRPGMTAIVAVVAEADYLAAQQALAGAPARSAAVVDEKGLRDALVEAAQKFIPDRTVLPIPDRDFGGVAGRTLEGSVADWTIIAGPRAPEGAPNVLVVLIDDAGFGQPDTFGGPIPTPALSRVGQAGLVYNRFHVVALCSPTRAAMLTGRNQHRVGMGTIAESAGPYPGYTGSVPRSCAPIPKILRENGYVTGGFGKWHMTPDHEQGPAGPFNHWPQGWGFDHFWGFLSGAAGQWDPLVSQGNETIGVPEGKDGRQYYFPDDLTDKAVEWLHGVRAHNTEKPWFLYYSTGCAHAPHHVWKEWADRFKGQFDDGWDAMRERVFARQKEMGVVPQDAILTPRPDAFPAWDSLDADAKKLYARQMEVYAGFQANADWNVGRLLDAVEEMGEFDNTLIIYVWGDNGASLEGTITGSFNEMTFLNGIVLDPSQQLALIEQYGGIEALGGPHTAPHVAAAWAWAGNTPFQWGKQMASHLGGTRNPMVVSWPQRIAARGELRSQFTHVIDVGPTILEAAGIPEPKLVDGIEQEPMDGTSFGYTFDDAQAAERHTVQYFEVIGSRAIYKDGWWACSKLDKLPWDLSPQTLAQWGPGSGWDPDKDPWELYYLPDDFSQGRDLAAQHPEKLEELKALFWQEAERNRALPLLGSVCVFFGILPPLPPVTRRAFAGDVQNVQKGLVPRVAGRSYAIEAEIVVPEGGAEGVLVANADFIGGWALWIDGQRRLNHTYSWLGVETYKQTSSQPVPTGDVTVKMLFEIDAPAPGAGGRVTLWANGEQIGEGRLDHSIPFLATSYAGLDMGRDNGLVVDRAYEDKAPYPFTGRLKQVVFDLLPHAREDERALYQHAATHALAAGVAG